MCVKCYTKHKAFLKANPHNDAIMAAHDQAIMEVSQELFGEKERWASILGLIGKPTEGIEKAGIAPILALITTGIYSLLEGEKDDEIFKMIAEMVREVTEHTIERCHHKIGYNDFKDKAAELALKTGIEAGLLNQNETADGETTVSVSQNLPEELMKALRNGDAAVTAIDLNTEQGQNLMDMLKSFDPKAKKRTLN